MHLCPWSLALASSVPVLGFERFCPRKGCPWPWPWPRIFFVSLALALASSLVSSTPPLLLRFLICVLPTKNCCTFQKENFILFIRFPTAIEVLDLIQGNIIRKKKQYVVRKFPTICPNTINSLNVFEVLLCTN